MTERYPPAPWQLHGQMYGVYLKMPPGSVPETLTPRVPGHRDRQADNVVPGTVLRIWVDSDPALFGGREMWHIPKEMSQFEFDHGAVFTGSLSLDGKEAVSYRFTPKRTVPGRWPFSLWLTQESDTGLRCVDVPAPSTEKATRG